MQAPAITQRQLSIFRAIMLHGSLSRAADATASSQPTLSRELARLEQLLGFALFDRVSRRLRPTVRAMALMQEVERSFVGLEHIAQRALALRTQVNGQLRMACLPALAHALVPHALQQLARALPSAGVRVDSMESPWLEQATSEQRYDLALSETTQAPAGVDLQPLLQANEVAVLPAAHPLSRRRVLRAQDFAGQRFISLAADDPYRHAIDAWFVQSGIERLLCLEASSAVAVCAMVRQGLGLAIVNPLTALECCGAQLVVRPLEIDIPFRISLLLPTIVAPHPQRDVMVQALIQAARWVEATASKAGHTKT